MGPTKEEISLCKQVAERYRKEINAGDWVKIEKPISSLFLLKICPAVCQFGRLYDAPAEGESQGMIADKSDWFPLWTISDCISWLHEQGNVVKLEVSESSSIKLHHLENRSDSSDYEGYNNKTPLEACLKAVLAVVKEGK